WCPTCLWSDVMIPISPHDPTVVSELMVVDPLLVKSLSDKVFRRRVSLMAHNGGTSG
ncbi:hypothetical protein A2U01_0009064, partial [Trifolium medium]|nr:hypothetical protein [Trifolium medium]